MHLESPAPVVESVSTNPESSMPKSQPLLVIALSPASETLEVFGQDIECRVIVIDQDVDNPMEAAGEYVVRPLHAASRELQTLIREFDEKMAASRRRRTTILAALRQWQHYIELGHDPLKDFEEHFEDVDPLNAEEIDEICEKLNFGEAI